MTDVPSFCSFGNGSGHETVADPKDGTVIGETEGLINETLRELRK